MQRYRWWGWHRIAFQPNAPTVPEWTYVHRRSPIRRYMRPDADPWEDAT
ncbi:MAG: hypothetical protein M3070_07835 [Actinomycetota bacterium]|nr:hypothetical protein [Actinomycetota bacterium]